MSIETKKMGWVIVFAIAMGFLESAVVIYLREIYYKEGFAFPLKPMPAAMALVEICREAATMLMLIGIGYLAGHTKLQRFAYFNLAFAVWDIFYYVFLYIFLGWPQTLATWDILFLIPFPWVGPVWAPCLLSALMIVGSLFVIHRTGIDKYYSISRRNWCLLICGALTCILSFMWDYLEPVLTGEAWSVFSSRPLFSEIHSYIPQSFNYTLFFSGFAAMAYPVYFHLTEKNKTS